MAARREAAIAEGIISLTGRKGRAGTTPSLPQERCGSVLVQYSALDVPDDDQLQYPREGEREDVKLCSLGLARSRN